MKAAVKVGASFAGHPLYTQQPPYGLTARGISGLHDHTGKQMGYPGETSKRVPVDTQTACHYVGSRLMCRPPGKYHPLRPPVLQTTSKEKELFANERKGAPEWIQVSTRELSATPHRRQLTRCTSSPPPPGCHMAAADVSTAAVILQKDKAVIAE